jgi:AbrB family looped-hinge helix DNA binding protein
VIEERMNTIAKGTMTSKGRITIPKKIRDYLRLWTGRRVEFQIDRQGQVIVQPMQVDIRELKGIVRSRRKTPLSIEEMNEAIARGWSGT